VGGLQAAGCARPAKLTAPVCCRAQEGERRVEELAEARARHRDAAARPAATPTPPRDAGRRRDAAPPSRRRPREDDGDDGRGAYAERRPRHEGPHGRAAPAAADDDRWAPRPATPDGDDAGEGAAFEAATREPVAAEAPQEAPGGPAEDRGGAGGVSTSALAATAEAAALGGEAEGGAPAPRASGSS